MTVWPAGETDAHVADLADARIVPTPLFGRADRLGRQGPRGLPSRRRAETGYRPSTALEEFVRFRDFTCRFPGCQEPAEFCDIDHTIPYLVGVTHPSNVKCLCRKQQPRRRSTPTRGSSLRVEPYLIQHQRLGCSDERWRRLWRRPHAFL
jgi:hypothetical protein